MNRKRSSLHLEQLETRYAPATLVNPFTVTYQDEDHDIVTVKFSKPILEQATINNVFDFSVGDVSGVNSQFQQLRLIDLTALANPQAAKGTSISVTAVRGQTSGDGFANVGRINATGIDLGAVSVKGDLADIDAGDGAVGNALASLTVQSMGRFGLSTGATDAESEIQGVVPTVSIKTDLKGVFLQFVDPNAGPMASVTVGGSIIGGATSNSGGIECPGNVGVVKIGGDIVGGGGVRSGDFQALGGAGAVTVGGSLIGSAGLFSGYLNVSDNVGSVKISGSLIGGAGNLSGVFQCTRVLGSAFVGGSFIGGSGEQSGLFDLSQGVGAAMKIVGSMIGGVGDSSGQIRTNDRMGPVSIGGDLVGGNGNDSGRIHTGSLASLKIGGSIIGGGGETSGCIDAGDDNVLSGLIQIQGDVRGGSGEDSGSVLFIFDPVSTVKIGGSVRSGTGLHSGSVRVRQANSISITGGLVGTAANPVIILAEDQGIDGAPSNVPLRKLSIGRSVEFAQVLTGYDVSDLGPKNGGAGIGAVTVGGDWIASSIVAGIDDGADDKFGTNDDAVLFGGNGVLTVRITSIAIGGMVRGTVGGTDHFGFVAEQIGSLSIGGTAILLTAGVSSDDVALGTTGDFNLKEV